MVQTKYPFVSFPFSLRSLQLPIIQDSYKEYQGCIISVLTCVLCLYFICTFHKLNIFLQGFIPWFLQRHTGLWVIHKKCMCFITCLVQQLVHSCSSKTVTTSGKSGRFESWAGTLQRTCLDFYVACVDSRIWWRFLMQQKNICGYSYTLKKCWIMVLLCMPMQDFFSNPFLAVPAGWTTLCWHKPMCYLLHC